MFFEGASINDLTHSFRMRCTQSFEKSHLFKAGVAVKYLCIESISKAIVTHHPHMSVNFGKLLPPTTLPSTASSIYLTSIIASVDNIIMTTIQSTFSPKNG